MDAQTTCDATRHAPADPSFERDENYREAILINQSITWVRSQQRSEHALLVSNNKLSSDQIRVGLPPWAAKPGIQGTRDLLVTVDIRPAIDRYRKLRKAPNEKSTPVEVVKQRPG